MRSAGVPVPRDAPVPLHLIRAAQWHGDAARQSYASGHDGWAIAQQAMADAFALRARACGISEGRR